MSNKTLAVILAVAGVLVFGLAVSMPAPHPVVGADGSDPVGTVIPWTDLLKALGGGSILTSILAFWGKIQPFAAPIIHTINPALPLPPADLGKTGTDTIEFVQAALAYASKRDDKNLQRRAVLAAITEIGDMAEMESPSVAAALNALLSAATNVWLPVPADPSTGVKA